MNSSFPKDGHSVTKPCPKHENNNTAATKQNKNNEMSRVMRKPTFCICKNKDADQLRGCREADQGLCFRYIDSTIPLLSKSEISRFWPSSIVCVGPGRKPDRWFSHDAAQISKNTHCQVTMITCDKHNEYMFHRRLEHSTKTAQPATSNQIPGVLVL